MSSKRFNPAKLEKLNNPARLKLLPPDFIIERAGLKQADVIIDLGAGTGLYSAAFASSFASAKVYATDISDLMVDWMKETRMQAHHNLIPLLMADSCIDLPDGISDFVCMINLHHELDNVQATLKECYRLLKVGGIIAISDWKKEEADMGPGIAIRVSPEEVEQQLLATGFSDVSINTELKYNYLVVAQK